jgi:hypothetical protein
VFSDESETPATLHNDLREWTDQIPYFFYCSLTQLSVTVPPHFSAEVVDELFRKMGPRYVLVTNMGCFEGIIAKADLIEYIRNQRYGNVET